MKPSPAKLRDLIERIKADHPLRDRSTHNDRSDTGGGHRREFVMACYAVCQDVRKLSELTGYKVHHIRKIVLGDKVTTS